MAKPGPSNDEAEHARSRLHADRQQERIDDLEAQLQKLSVAAAAAFDRVSELENQLAALQSRQEPRITPSSSVSSISSLGNRDFERMSPVERLERLEIALESIKGARKKIKSRDNFSYY